MVTKAEIIRTYHGNESIKATAAFFGISAQSVRRILIEAGEYSSATSSEIIFRRQAGETVSQIAEALGIGRKAVISYLPYEKGSYCVGEKTANANRIAAFRKRGQFKNKEAQNEG